MVWINAGLGAVLRAVISLPVCLSMISDRPRRGLNEMFADRTTRSPSLSTVVGMGGGRKAGKSVDVSGGNAISFKRFSCGIWMVSILGPAIIRGAAAFSHLAYSIGASSRARYEACMPNRWQISEEESSPGGMYSARPGKAWINIRRTASSSSEALKVLSGEEP